MKDTDRSIVSFVKRIFSFLDWKNICRFQRVWQLSAHYRLMDRICWGLKTQVALEYPLGYCQMRTYPNLLSFMAFLTSANVTSSKGNLTIFLNLLLTILILRWLWDFRTLLSMVSRLWAKPVTFHGHLKIFKEVTISAK